jgi:hypothetical protein
VSGNVSLMNAGPGSGLAGVTVSINSTPVQTTTTDATGNFSFSVPNGSYVVTPSYPGASSLFSPLTQNVTVSGASPAPVNFMAALGFTVSGSVSYAGAKTGRIYLTLNGPNGFPLGNSITAPGAFTIRGVPPGTYTLHAWMDNIGRGFANASNPAGDTFNVTVSSANLSGANVTLADPTVPSIAASSPTISNLAATSGGAIVFVNPINNPSSVEIPTSYTVQWDTSNTFPAPNSKTFSAIGGDNPFIVSGLGNGASLFFRVRGQATTTSNWSPAFGPVTIGSPASGNVVSGTVTFSGIATGPMYVGFFDQNTSTLYATTIAAPVSPQTYTINVPSGTNYFNFAIIDQNNNGLIDLGDITNVNQDNGVGITISGATIGQNITLSGANSLATLRTSHFQFAGQPNDSYNLNIDVNQVMKQPVAVALVSGNGLLWPMDIGLQSNKGGRFQFWPNMNNVRPNVGDAYGVSVTYSDGTSETLNPTVSGVVDAFASNLAPAGNILNTTPAFTWTDPANASNYIYSFNLSDQNGNNIWQIPQKSNGFASTITSITWGTDPLGTGNLPSVGSLSSGGNYQWNITVIDSLGNSAMEQTSFTVNGVTVPPSIISQPGNQVVTEGQAANFSVNASGTAPLSYQWNKNGTPIPGATFSNYTTPPTALADNGAAFTVTVSNSAGQVTSNAATLTVNPLVVAPSITTQPSNQSVTVGQTASFSVFVSGTAPFTYQWSKNGTPILGATSSIYTTPPTALTDSGATFTVSVSNAGGTVGSNPATLTVTGAPVAPFITAQPANQIVSEGQTATFSVTATGTAPLNYQWSRNGVAIAGATSFSYTTPATALADSGSTFTVHVTNMAGFADSSAATLTVNPLATFQVSGNVSLANAGPNGVSGVTISINTTPVQTTTTDASGTFFFGGVPNGDYTITPSLAGASAIFYPATQNVTVSGSNTFTNFMAAVGYTLSGTVNYAGPRTGRIYLSLNGGNSFQLGTSIGALGAFSIRGVSPGSNYVLQAWMDNVGQGVQNTSNPTGSVVNISVNGNTGGVIVTLSDPTPPTLSSAPGMNIAGTDQGAVVFVNPIRDSNGVEIGVGYQFQWSAVSDFSSGVGTVTVPAMGGNNPYLIGSLTNGTSLFFRVRGKLPGGLFGPWSGASAAIPIGPNVSGNVVSGTVTFPGTATGPMYVGFFDQNTNAIYATTIAAPVSPQAYTVTVPSGTNYFNFAIIDQNHDSAIDAGDIANVNQGNSTGLAINGPISNQNVVLSSANANVVLTTNHSQFSGGGPASDNYGLNFDVRGQIKRPVAVALTGGAGALAPMDIAMQAGNNNGGRFQFWPNIGGVRPTVSGTYPLSITYSDGTSETLNPAVTGVLDAFVTNMSPSGSGSGNTTPTFTWTDPANASNYIYSFNMWDQTGGNIWQIPQNSNGFSSATTSITWGIDPTGGGSAPTVPSLTVGKSYQWNISVMDTLGNSASAQTSYTP